MACEQHEVPPIDPLERGRQCSWGNTGAASAPNPHLSGSVSQVHVCAACATTAPQSDFVDAIFWEDGAFYCRACWWAWSERGAVDERRTKKCRSTDAPDTAHVVTTVAAGTLAMRPRAVQRGGR